MLAIIGRAVVTLSVFVGFILEGGPMLVMIQPAEFLIIGGAAFGTLLIAVSASLLKQLMQQALGAIRPSPFVKAVVSERIRS
jgi:chemotaxis protein MotA